MDGWKDGYYYDIWIDKWNDGWNDGWMDGRINIYFRSICQMAKDNDGILSFINFSKLSLITIKLKEKLGKCVKAVEKKSKERSQYLKWIVSLYESLAPYVDKTDINDSQLQTELNDSQLH